MDQQPKIPTLKDAQKPQVKIKGMGAGLTLFDRLKQFKKKDLAFILAGLGTLFMAPLAEHFMMAPENGDAALQQGWGKGGTGGGSFFGGGSSPYESGSNLASGGAIGGGGDIITPLNVRDPSSLVMGPGGTQQPPAGSAAPAAPPPTAPARSDDELKDALKGAASRGASAALKKAPLPVPKVALGGSGLRGLGVAAGGSSASGGSLPVGPAAGSVGGGGGGGLRLVRNTPGFKGVAGSRSPTGGTGLDNTKRAGANAGDAFNRAGSAAAGLNAAASETIPTGGQGFGGGGQGGVGANDKPGSGSGPGGSKSVGESLAFLRAKQRQEEELKLEFEKRKLKDPELLLYGIRNDSLKAMASEVTKSLTKHITGFLDPSAGGSSAVIKCPGMPDVPLASARKCEKPEDFACFAVSGSNYSWIATRGSNGVACQVSGAADAGSNPNAVTAPSTAGGVLAGAPTGPGAAAAANLKEFCDLLDKEIVEQKKETANAIAQQKLAAAEKIRAEVGKIVAKRDGLYGTATANSCDARTHGLRTDQSVYEYRGTAVAGLLEEGGLFTNAGVPGLIKAATDPKGTVKDGAIKTAREKYGKAMTLLQKVEDLTVDTSAFETRLFVDGGGTFQRLIGNAKTANDAVIDYAQKERNERLPALEPLIKGAELAGLSGGKPSVPEVVKVNAAYDAMAQRATAVGVTPGQGETVTEPSAPDPAAPKAEPQAEYEAVIATVDAAQTAVGTSPSEGAMKAVADIEAKKKEDPAYEPDAAAKQPITDAWKAWGDMQKKQVQVLSAINGGLTDMKKGVTAPAAPVVASAE